MLCVFNKDTNKIVSLFSMSPTPHLINISKHFPLRVFHLKC